MGDINNCPETQTQTPKHLHTKKLERVIGLPVEIFPDAEIWVVDDFLHSEQFFFAQ